MTGRHSKPPRMTLSRLADFVIWGCYLAAMFVCAYALSVSMVQRRGTGMIVACVAGLLVSVVAGLFYRVVVMERTTPNDNSTSAATGWGRGRCLLDRWTRGVFNRSEK